MSLQGLPDFQQPITADAAQIFYPYEGVGPHLLTPDRLDVASRPDGAPDFALDIVRGRTPLLPPRPYGVLDFRLQAHYRLAESLGLVREHQPAATLAPTMFRSGFLRLRQTAATADVPAELLRPVELAWNGLGITRTTLRLSLDGAMLLRRALGGDALLLDALCELELVGVAPRLPVQVSFDPFVLLRELIALGSTQRVVAVEQLNAFFRRDLRELPVTLHGTFPADDQGRAEFVAAMVDRVRERFGSFVASPADDGAAHIALADPATLGSGHFAWDLSEPLVAARTIALRLDPLAAARLIVQERGLAAIVRERVVPPIPRGTLSVAVSANLPASREGVFALGVNLYAAQRLPQRPQASVGSAELVAPQDAATVTLSLSPGEPPQYTYTTFAVVRDAGGIEQLEGPETAHEGELLNLTTDDFPLEFVAVSAASALLELAALRGVLRHPDNGGMVEQSFELSLTRPALAIGMPRNVEGATIEIAAQERNGVGVLQLGPLPAQDLQLDSSSFREYGPQQVEIECIFAPGVASFAIELLPVGLPETNSARGVLSFRPELLVRRWTYFAESPFHGGYCFRTYRGPGQPPAPWSEARSPFERLVLRVGANQEVEHD